MLSSVRTGELLPSISQEAERPLEISQEDLMAFMANQLAIAQRARIQDATQSIVSSIDIIAKNDMVCCDFLAKKLSDIEAEGEILRLQEEAYRRQDEIDRQAAAERQVKRMQTAASLLQDLEGMRTQMNQFKQTK